MNCKECGVETIGTVEYCKRCDESMKLGVFDEHGKFQDFAAPPIKTCAGCDAAITKDNDSRWAIPLPGGKWQSECIDCHYGITQKCKCGWEGTGRQIVIRTIDFGDRIPEEGETIAYSHCPQCDSHEDLNQTPGRPGSGRAAYEEEERKFAEEAVLQAAPAISD